MPSNPRIDQEHQTARDARHERQNSLTAEGQPHPSSHSMSREPQANARP